MIQARSRKPARRKETITVSALTEGGGLMILLSQLLQRPVYDQAHTRIGTLVDALISLPQAGTPPVQAGTPVRVSPLVQALLVQRPDRSRLQVSPIQVEQVKPSTLQVNGVLGVLPLAAPSPARLSLAADVLDHQIIDLAHRQVRRVNDIGLDAQWRVVGVACSPVSGLFRLAPAWLAVPLAPRVTRSLVPWHHVALFPSAAPDAEGAFPLLPTAGPGALTSWSGAAVAALVRTLRPYEGSQVLAALPPPLAARALLNLVPLQRSRVLKHLPVPQAVALLKELPPALAARVLEGLPDARAQAVMEALDAKETALLQVALAYPTDSAGRFMTSACLRISQECTAASALTTCSAWAGPSGQRAYLYCVSDMGGTPVNEHLAGVVSLWDVLAADPDRRLQDIMHTELVSVSPETDLEAVAVLLEEYGLLALPVVDALGALLGVVTLEAVLSWHLAPPHRTRH